MIVVAVCALLLFPITKTVHKAEQLRLGRLRGAHEAKIARELGRMTRREALRAIAIQRAGNPDRNAHSVDLRHAQGRGIPLRLQAEDPPNRGETGPEDIPSRR